MDALNRFSTNLITSCYCCGATAAASHAPPTGIGDPALCGSLRLVTPISSCIDLETRGFAVFFLCFLVCILVKIDSR